MQICGDPWVAQQFSTCLWPRARSWSPGDESCLGLPAWSLLLLLPVSLPLSLSLSIMNKIFKKNKKQNANLTMSHSCLNPSMTLHYSQDQVPNAASAGPCCLPVFLPHTPCLGFLDALFASTSSLCTCCGPVPAPFATLAPAQQSRLSGTCPDSWLGLGLAPPS